MEPADEMKFEVSTDVHGTADGPRLGRQRVINKVRSSPAVHLYDHSKHSFCTVYCTVRRVAFKYTDGDKLLEIA